MLIYNVTVNIDNSVHDEWLEYMRTKHIGDVVNTGCFLSGEIFRIMVEEQQGTSYSIQYRCENMETLQRYMNNFAPALQKEVKEKYGDKFVAFRTVLEKC
jgi:predicted transport protein